MFLDKVKKKIYEILISDDPENELEKYYDIAPNNFLKRICRGIISNKKIW